jgi:hypothetical protein
MNKMLDFNNPVTKVILQDTEFDEYNGTIQILFPDIEENPTEYEVFVDTVGEDFFYTWSVADATSFGIELSEGLIYFIKYE